MRITSPVLAYRFFHARLSPHVEEVWTLALNAGKDVIATELLFRGTVDHCLLHPREVFRFALRCNASSILLAHNHPTGIAYPSPQDLEVTKQLIAAGRLMGIPLEDHLILAGQNYYSFTQGRSFTDVRGGRGSG